tara:strand:- start:49064 stop:51496 length:2433 start_codon:yes stop_codon:yes gene_type:complete
MIRNYIKIAFRSLKKQSFFTLLNIFGLSVGMAGSLLIALYIYDELSYDKMFLDADRIYRIDTDIKFGGAEIKASEAAPPMAAAMKNDFSVVETTVRFRDRGSMLVKKSGTNTNTKELNATFVDSTFFKMFGIELIIGDEKTALTEVNTLVLTRTAAEKHFGIENAIGQSLLLNNSDTYIVTGVMEDLPKNSFLRDHSIFMAMSGNVASRENLWGSNNYFTFVKLIPGANIDNFQIQLQGMLEKYMMPWAQSVFPGMTAESFEASGNYIRYHTMALTNIHLYSNRQTEMSANGSIQNVYILFFIGLFLIFLACVNFMNLSTAHSLKRAKEVGVRKTLGSNYWDLVWQFLTESGLITFISMVFALVLTIIVLPFFNELSGKAIEMPYANPLFWLLILLATILLGFLAGSYPALFMSRFNPIVALKGIGQRNTGAGNIRSILVVFQFAVAVFLIVSTLVVYQQLKFIQNKDLGFNKEQVLLINDTFASGNQLDVFKEDVLKLSAVQSATISDFFPTPSSRSSSSFFEEKSMSQEHAIQMQTWTVDLDYLSTLNIELLAGRNFDKKYVADSTSVIINESILSILGVSAENALGMRISEEVELENPVFYKIIGVVKNFHYSSLRDNIGGLGLFLDKSSGTMAIKLKSDDLSGIIASIESIWNKRAPGQPFNYRFMDESFNTTYEAEHRLGRIFIIFTLLSITIACLGLFGLSAFNAQKRMKEIGVRKVLGASVGQITYRLTTDFLKLIGIATVIAIPLGWYSMNKWLGDFSYRIEISWKILAFSALLVVMVAILTVSYQSIKAAIANPIKSLRTE